MKVLDRQRLRAFLIGGVAGLVAGVIFAPRSGRELRGSIADRAGEARERSRETLFEAQERLQERRAAVREGSHRRPDGVGDAAEGPAESSVTGLGGNPPPGETAPQRPRLREVPRDDAAEERLDEDAGREAERSDELRRKVRETRARLRERLDSGSGGSGRGPEDNTPGPGR